MSLWWMTGVGAGTSTGDAERNAPSLYGGGVLYADADAPVANGVNGYYQASESAQTGRTGVPELTVAIGGYLVLEQLKSASWSLGRDDWLSSSLAPTTASFEFVDKPPAAAGDTIVVGLMSNLKAYHSGALWVGTVDGRSSTRDLNDQATTTISATDVVGALGQASAPTSIAAGWDLRTLIEHYATAAGVPLRVDTDPLVALPTFVAVADISGSLLELINQAERSSNALLFLRGNGRLYAAMRDRTGASSVKVIEADGADSPSSWSDAESLGNVVTRWNLGAADGSWGPTTTDATTIATYGERSYDATDLIVADPTPYANLIASDVMATPRPIVTEASFPVRDLSQEMPWVDPLDRITADGQTWQVMSVRHSVVPTVIDENGATKTEWRMSISADVTQEALAGADEPGPVTPPGAHDVTQTVISDKSMYVYKQGATESGDATSVFLPVGYDTGVKQRALIAFPIVWPTGYQDVVSAVLHIRNFNSGNHGTHPRIYVRRNTEDWDESLSTVWPGPDVTTYGNRVVDIPPDAFSWTAVSITHIARDWHDHGNYGLRLQSVDETAAWRRAMFHSDDSSESSRPYLVLTCSVIT